MEERLNSMSQHNSFRVDRVKTNLAKREKMHSAVIFFFFIIIANILSKFEMCSRSEHSILLNNGKNLYLNI